MTRTSEPDVQDEDYLSAHPWLRPLSVEARKAVVRNAAAAPPLTDRQRENLRLLFRGGGGDGAA